MLHSPTAARATRSRAATSPATTTFEKAFMRTASIALLPQRTTLGFKPQPTRIGSNRAAVDKGDSLIVRSLLLVPVAPWQRAGRYPHRGHRAEFFRCEDSFSTSGGSAMVITRWSSTDSATAATAHVFPLRTRVSPMWGTRSVTAYSQSPLAKRMVIDPEAIGPRSPLYLTRCQVGTAGGRAVGSSSRVAELVPFETLCSSVITSPVWFRGDQAEVDHFTSTPRKRSRGQRGELPSVVAPRESQRSSP